MSIINPENYFGKQKFKEKYFSTLKLANKL
jgi:hypothetical protein